MTWSHHALLAGLEPEEQQHWLARASEEGFSVEDLRIELCAAQRGGYVHSASENSSTDGQSACLECPKCGEQVPIPEDMTKAIQMYARQRQPLVIPTRPAAKPQGRECT